MVVNKDCINVVPIGDEHPVLDADLDIRVAFFISV